MSKIIVLQLLLDAIQAVTGLDSTLGVDKIEIKTESESPWSLLTAIQCTQTRSGYYGASLFTNERDLCIFEVSRSSINNALLIFTLHLTPEVDYQVPADFVFLLPIYYLSITQLFSIHSSRLNTQHILNIECYRQLSTAQRILKLFVDWAYFHM